MSIDDAKSIVNQEMIKYIKSKIKIIKEMMKIYIELPKDLTDLLDEAFAFDYDSILKSLNNIVDV